MPRKTRSRYRGEQTARNPQTSYFSVCFVVGVTLTADGPSLLGRGSFQNRMLPDVCIWVALHYLKANLYKLYVMRYGLGRRLEKRMDLILKNHC